jgi:hypothetical protein
MKKWADFTEAETNAVKSAAVALCINAAGITVTDAVTTAMTTLFGSAIAPYSDAGVRCYWNPTEDGTVGIVGAGRPYLPDIVGLLRNFEGNFLPKYGRKSESESINKSGTEQVSLASTGSTLEEKITVSAPDVRAATIGNSSASDVDAAEKMRFDSETEKSLYLLFSKWVRRASVDEDV